MTKPRREDPASADPRVDESIGPPSRALALLELRLFAESAASLVASPVLKRAVRGDGHAVMVIPGIGQGDFTTAPLRWFLRRQGYAAYGWGQGFNRGSSRAGEALAGRIAQLAGESGGPVSLVGWSWGGIHARELAKQMPEQVRSVVTLGTPFTGNPTANNLTWLYELLSGRPSAVRPRWFELRRPPPVPNTSVYSRSDGVVAWRCCLNEPGRLSENVEVVSSHLGMAHHPAVLYLLADRLAQAPGAWIPYRPPASLRWLYPEPAQ